MKKGRKRLTENLLNIFYDSKLVVILNLVVAIHILMVLLGVRSRMPSWQVIIVKQVNQNVEIATEIGVLLQLLV